MIQARVRGYRARVRQPASTLSGLWRIEALIWLNRCLVLLQIRAEHLQHARVNAAAAMAIGGEGITAARKAAAAATPTGSSPLPAGALSLSILS